MAQGNNGGGENFGELLAKLLGGLVGGLDQPKIEDVWRRATEPKAAPAAKQTEPSAAAQRENLVFALATRAVEALEDIALNAAAIRQRLERNEGRASAEGLARETEREDARRTGHPLD